MIEKEQGNKADPVDRAPHADADRRNDDNKQNTQGMRGRADMSQPAAASDPMEQMKRDVSLVIASLDNPDPAQRQAALHIGMLYWKHDETLKNRIMKAAKEDSDVDVRIGAIRAIWPFHRVRSNHVSSGRALQTFLATFVLDEAEWPEQRRIAYYTLLLTAGRTEFEGPRSIRLRFPEDVDWVWVNRFL
jgi:hypothetical protein